MDGESGCGCAVIIAICAALGGMFYHEGKTQYQKDEAEKIVQEQIVKSKEKSIDEYVKERFKGVKVINKVYPLSIAELYSLPTTVSMNVSLSGYVSNVSIQDAPNNQSGKEISFNLNDENPKIARSSDWTVCFGQYTGDEESRIGIKYLERAQTFSEKVMIEGQTQTVKDKHYLRVNTMKTMQNGKTVDYKF